MCLGYIYGGELDCIYDLSIDDNLKLLDILRLMLFHSAFEALYYVTLYKVLATFGRDDVDPKEYYLALDMAISLNLPKVEQELLVCLHVIINLSLNPDIVENITYEVFQKIMAFTATWNSTDISSEKVLKRFKLFKLWIEKHDNDIAELKHHIDLTKFTVDDLMGEVRESKMFDDSEILEAVAKKYQEDVPSHIPQTYHYQ